MISNCRIKKSSFRKKKWIKTTKIKTQMMIRINLLAQYKSLFLWNNRIYRILNNWTKTKNKAKPYLTRFQKKKALRKFKSYKRNNLKNQAPANNKKIMSQKCWKRQFKKISKNNSSKFNYPYVSKWKTRFRKMRKIPKKCRQRKKLRSFVKLCKTLRKEVSYRLNTVLRSNQNQINNLKNKYKAE